MSSATKTDAMTAPTAALPRDADHLESLPTITVIVPVKNDAHRLAVLLESLQQQDYPRDRWRLIVADNGSTDDSRDVAARHGALVLVHPDARVGQLRNRAAEIADTDLLALVDSDHEVPPDWLRCGARALALGREFAMAGSAYLAPPRGTWVQRAWEVHRLRWNQQGEARWLASGNMFVRLADYRELGGFREDLVASEDVDLCIRLSQRGKRILNDPSIRNIHHGEPVSLAHFSRKEYWRGSSGVRAFFQQGMPLREIPTLVWPLLHLILGPAFVVALLMSAARVIPWFTPLIVLALLIGPSALLAFRTCWVAGRFRYYGELVILFLVFGFTRAAALFK